jgi:carbon-monoxide dehydrogenase iron sulfur subunit
MNGCITKDAETGQMLHDQTRCVGCWMCVMVCPFGAIATGGENERGLPIAIRCDLCEGEKETLCTMVCPTGAITCVEE